MVFALGPVTSIDGLFFKGKISFLFFKRVIDSEAALYASSLCFFEPKSL